MRQLPLPKGAKALTGADAATPTSLGSRLNLLIGDRRRLIAALAACSIVSGFIEAATLALVAHLAVSLVGQARHGSGAGHTQLSLFNLHASEGTLILVAFALCGLRLLFQVPLSILPARIASDVQARVRTELFDAFSRASWSVQSGDREGRLQEVMTGQVMQAVGGAVGMTGLITSTFQFIVLMVSAILLSPLAAVLVGSMSVGMFALLRPLRGRGVRNARKLSAAQVGYAGGIAESNRLAEEAHVFGAAGAQRERIALLVSQSQRFFYRAQLLTRLITNVYQSLIVLLLVAGIGILYLIGGGHAGSLGAVVLVLLRAGMTGQTVQSAYQSLIQALPFIERTQNALLGYEASVERSGEVRLTSISTLSFDRVSFAYRQTAPVLSEICFDVRAGEAIGIVGPSGAGKSTLVQLLLRLRRPVDGRYLINGAPAENFADADWHRQISYVPQEPRLLHASVAENIRFFREIDAAQVERAARLARIHDDIVGWKDGYETIVGPRADAVSGGQQQRICLARALAAQPQVLILDEPTSALDPQSEALISASLLAIRSDLTLFIVAHRMSTLEMCDRVMVILDGRVAGLDTKAALQRDNPYYRNASRLATAGQGS